LSADFPTSWEREHGAGDAEPRGASERVLVVDRAEAIGVRRSRPRARVLHLNARHRGGSARDSPRALRARKQREMLDLALWDDPLAVG
jgi:hypothetical protein